MPEGPLGAPRLTNIGPLSRATKEEIKRQWEECPEGGKPEEICLAYKESAIAILEGQGFFAECNDLIDINSGSCFDIVERVYDEVDGVRVMVAGDRDHAWIMYRGVHYDAEAPTGVEDAFDLPIFGRISPRNMLRHAQMRAEIEGEPEPTHPRDTVKDITEEYSLDE